MSAFERQELYRKALGVVGAWKFPEGTFLHGWEIGTDRDDLVRDSTLNPVNDYTVFGETFEKIALAFDVPTNLLITSADGS